MNLNSLFKSATTRAQLINYQTVRWKRPRKPFWLGMAKSKMFVIPQPKVIRTPEEIKTMNTLKRNYDCRIKSLLHFIREDNPHIVATHEEGDELSEALLQQMSESLERNVSFNEESAKRREERLKRTEEEESNKALELLELKEKEEIKQLEFIEEIVRKEKAYSKSFITPENLDEAIEKCLSNVEQNDFAIDLEGNVYHGRESLQTQSQISEAQAESSAS